LIEKLIRTRDTRPHQPPIAIQICGANLLIRALQSGVSSTPTKDQTARHCSKLRTSPLNIHTFLRRPGPLARVCVHIVGPSQLSNAKCRLFSTTAIMTSKWDCNGRSIDLTGKKRLVVVDFDNTCAFLTCVPFD